MWVSRAHRKLFVFVLFILTTAYVLSYLFMFGTSADLTPIAYAIFVYVIIYFGYLLLDVPDVEKEQTKKEEPLQKELIAALGGEIAVTTDSEPKPFSFDEKVLTSLSGVREGIRFKIQRTAVTTPAGTGPELKEMRPLKVSVEIKFPSRLEMMEAKIRPIIFKRNIIRYEQFLIDAENRDVALEFVQKNISDIKKLFGKGYSRILRISNGNLYIYCKQDKEAVIKALDCLISIAKRA